MKLFKMKHFLPLLLTSLITLGGVYAEVEAQPIQVTQSLPVKKSPACPGCGTSEECNCDKPEGSEAISPGAPMLEPRSAFPRRAVYED